MRGIASGHEPITHGLNVAGRCRSCLWRSRTAEVRSPASQRASSTPVVTTFIAGPRLCDARDDHLLPLGFSTATSSAASPVMAQAPPGTAREPWPLERRRPPDLHRRRRGSRRRHRAIAHGRGQPRPLSVSARSAVVPSARHSPLRAPAGPDVQVWHGRRFVAQRANRRVIVAGAQTSDAARRVDRPEALVTDMPSSTAVRLE